MFDIFCNSSVRMVAYSATEQFLAESAHFSKNRFSKTSQANFFAKILQNFINLFQLN